MKTGIGEKKPSPEEYLSDLEVKKKDDGDKNTFLKKAEFICKCLAIVIIIISATFHLYRLFRYGNYIYLL